MGMGGYVAAGADELGDHLMSMHQSIQVDPSMFPVSIAAPDHQQSALGRSCKAISP